MKRVEGKGCSYSGKPSNTYVENIIENNHVPVITIIDSTRNTNKL